MKGRVQANTRWRQKLETKIWSPAPFWFVFFWLEESKQTSQQVVAFPQDIICGGNVTAHTCASCPGHLLCSSTAHFIMQITVYNTAHYFPFWIKYEHINYMTVCFWMHTLATLTSFAFTFFNMFLTFVNWVSFKPSYLLSDFFSQSFSNFHLCLISLT